MGPFQNMRWNAEKKDLEEILKGWREKKKRMEKEAEYSCPSKKGQKLKRTDFLVKSLENMLSNRQEMDCFLISLNQGSFKPEPVYLNHFLDRYFMKARIISSYFKPETQFKSKDPDPRDPAFRNLLASKLMASKLSRWMAQEFNGLSRVNRNRIIKDLVSKLRSISAKPENWIMIKGDFKSYTQNIRRKKLLGLMEKHGVPESTMTFVKKYLSSGNHVSRVIDQGTVTGFFRHLDESEYKRYIKDADFRSVINASGILPGSPLSTAFGLLYLAEFDSWAKDLEEDDGFYRRYFDDFVFITRKKSLKSTRPLIEMVAEIYGLKHAKDVKDILKYRFINMKEGFDFLGYMMRLVDGRIKVGIRYKTLKKFIHKYLVDYGIPRKSRGKAGKYLVAKCYYLHRWISSFIQINDLRLLDALYMRFILPDLHQSCHLLYGSEKYMDKLREIKTFFKPAIIYRVLRREKNDSDTVIKRMEKLKEILDISDR